MLLLPLALLLACSGQAADIHKALDCADPRASDAEACSQPVDDVVAVVPGASYMAQMECQECPYARRTGQLAQVGYEMERSDQILFLNLTLSPDNRTVLLNDKPFYPLQTIPTPPTFYATQFPATFSNTNLSSGIACSDPYCTSTVDRCPDWCWILPLSSIGLDYVYKAQPTTPDRDDRDAGAQYWHVTLDVIGGRSSYASAPRWKLDNADQKMLWLLVAGKEATTAKSKRTKDTKPASDLFSPFGEADKTFEYTIVDMKLQPRATRFPAPRRLSIWAKIGRFFGNDVWEEEGHFIYRSEEWGSYGKLGTLRNLFGEFVHWDMWWLFWIVVGSTIAAIFISSGLYKLFYWVIEQRELAKWDGMDDVWDRLRREPVVPEQDALLDGAYRDEPDEASSSRPPRYTDEPRVMKPLPSKPLPEKPLPEVPLIDA